MWKELKTNPIPSDEEVLGQNNSWISEYNPTGIRIGFLGTLGEFISVVYDNNQDCYSTVYDLPTKWMKIPVRYDRLENIFSSLFEEIKHGDQEHQDWLKSKLDDFLTKLVF